jgi:hypothetical protein
MKTFIYWQSQKIINWGCSFDSILELKFALSIKEEYEFLRSYIPIFYDPRTKLPTNYIRENIRRYTPDFLIRHKITRDAYLVEVKPRAFENEEQLAIRKAVAENYIRIRNYDWKFKIIFNDEIHLTGHQKSEFQNCCKRIPLSNKNLWLKELNDKFDSTRTSLFNVPSNRKVRFVMFGEKNYYYKGSE